MDWRVSTIKTLKTRARVRDECQEQKDTPSQQKAILTKDRSFPDTKLNRCNKFIPNIFFTLALKGP
jgi:hypothetical protein